MGADRGTCPANAALLIVKKYLMLRMLRFRILTPETTQWTSLEEYGSSYAGTVVNGIMLDIKNYAFIDGCFQILKTLITELKL